MTLEAQFLNLLVKRPYQIADCGTLAAHHFENALFGRVFDTVGAVHDSGGRVGYSTISARLSEPWVPDILGMISDATADGDVKTLSDAIIKSWMGREAQKIWVDNLSRLNGGVEQVEGIDAIIAGLTSLANNDGKERMTTMDKVALEVSESCANPGTEPITIKTGIPKLDRRTGGVHRGLLTIVAGLPSHGKSAFMANLIVNMAMAGEHVYFASLEDRANLVAGRVLARLAGVDSENINKRQDLSFEDIQAIQSASEKHKEALSRIHIDDASGQTLPKIRRNAMKLHAEGNMTVAFVDHIGEMGGDGERYDLVSRNAAGLRDIANDFDVPVIAGCQVSKKAVSKASGKNIDHEDCIPRSAHLRDSGNIEAVARNVWFVHRPWKWNDQNPENDFWLVVDKASHGKTRTIILESDLARMWIGDPQYG